MLVFTAFYSLELPFIFYRCQQLVAHMKFNHFSVTNCHHLSYSLGIACAWSPRNLCLNFIYTISVCVSLSHISTTFTQIGIPSFAKTTVAAVTVWSSSFCEEQWSRKRNRIIQQKYSSTVVINYLFSLFYIVSSHYFPIINNLSWNRNNLHLTYEISN